MGRSLNTRKSRQKHIERKILLKFTRKFDLKIIHLIKKKSNKLFFYANILTCLFHLRVNYIIAIIIIFKRSAIIVDIREVPAFNLEEIKSKFYILIALHKSFLFWEMIVLFFR